MRNVITSPEVFEAIRQQTGKEPLAVDHRGNYPKRTYRVWWDAHTVELLTLKPFRKHAAVQSPDTQQESAKGSQGVQRS